MESLAEAGNAVMNQFKLLGEAEISPSMQNIISEWPKNLFHREHERFERWAVDLGVFVLGHGSLGYRIRDSNDMRECLLYIMNGIKTTVDDVLEYLNGDIEPGGEDPNADEDPEPRPLMDLLLYSVQNYINSLYQLACFLRTPSNELGSAKARNLQLVDDAARCMQEDESADSPHTLGSELSRVTFSEIEPVISRDPGFVSVSDVHGSAQHVAFTLRSGKGMGYVATEERAKMQRDGCQTITLQDVISASKGAKLPLKSSMMLASKLSSTLFQFSRARWLDKALSKDSIFFLSHSEFNGATPVADLERPFVYAKMGGEISRVTIAQLRLRLLEFAILLLEIWHQTGLEDRFTDKTREISGGYYSRLALAAEWLSDKSNPPFDAYAAAVRYCIYGIPARHWNDWDIIELWGEICKEVIEPLANICEQL